MLDATEKRISEMGQAARRKVELEHSPRRHYEMLMDVYRGALEIHR